MKRKIFMGQKMLGWSAPIFFPPSLVLEKFAHNVAGLETVKPYLEAGTNMHRIQLFTVILTS